jgi:type VI secretion system secreted protein Hcp
MAIFMQYGSSIKGNVTTEGFANWIELNSLQWGTGRAMTTPTSKATAREASAPSISEVTVTKQLDPSSNGLFTDAVAGEMNTSCVIAFTTTTAGQTTEFLRYTLTNTGVSGYSVSSGGDRPTESLSLNFTKIEIKYSDMDSKNSGTPNTVGYDLTTQKSS